MLSSEFDFRSFNDRKQCLEVASRTFDFQRLIFVTAIHEIPPSLVIRIHVFIQV